MLCVYCVKTIDTAYSIVYHRRQEGTSKALTDLNSAISERKEETTPLDYLGIIILFVSLWIVQFILTFFQSRAMTKDFVDMKVRNAGNNLGVGLTQSQV